jgi:hypothetical protein
MDGLKPPDTSVTNALKIRIPFGSWGGAGRRRRMKTTITDFIPVLEKDINP